MLCMRICGGSPHTSLPHEPPGQTLQATALVHEAYMNVTRSDQQLEAHRGHFFMAAAEAIAANSDQPGFGKTKALKRGGNRKRVELREPDLVVSVPAEELLDLDEALRKHLSEHSPMEADPRQASRYFAGFTLTGGSGRSGDLPGDGLPVLGLREGLSAGGDDGSAGSLSDCQEFFQNQ